VTDPRNLKANGDLAQDTTAADQQADQQAKKENVSDSGILDFGGDVVEGVIELVTGIFD